MKWLNSRRDRRVLDAVAAFGPLDEHDLESRTGRKWWLTASLIRLINDGRVATDLRPGFFGGVRAYSIPGKAIKEDDK